MARRCEDGQDDAQQESEPPEEEAEVVAHGREHGVGCIACAAPDQRSNGRNSQIDELEKARLVGKLKAASGEAPLAVPTTGVACEGWLHSGASVWPLLRRMCDVDEFCRQVQLCESMTP